MDRSPARRHRARREALLGYAFVSPAVLLYALIGAYTVIYGVALSFFRWNGFTPKWYWYGLNNFKDFLYANPLQARAFWAAALHNLVILVALPLGVILISLPLAVALNSIQRFKAVLRSIFFLPMVTSGIAVFYTWRWIYMPDGFLARLLKAVGLGALAPADGFLGNIHWALPAAILVMIWGATPFAILLYLTGLQTIDHAVYDAARIDGASGGQVLRHITWPLLYPATGLLLIINLSGALQGFEPILLMTDGGPAGHTDVFGLQIYHGAFGGSGGSGDLGQVSALAWTLFLLTLGFSFINLKFFRQRA